ncbi:hypothetical protein ACTOB_003703 [Actinoplanes oblitus]|uniref:YcaO domain-containing protein n=1 Tax=Actinoplanes oblitus TaxID=3040509 RepID=A0ABY8WRD9_9ACTN|nr:hypothetical protein [Actinoplanes oblitus]WIN00028.1 hypothetical protein ACTOB_003703 [Actinoplanes oblitus]
MRITEQRAWTRISALGDVTVDSLTGRCLHQATPEDITTGTLTDAAARELTANLERPAGEAVTGDAIYYVVCSHGTPVAWLTYDARVITPGAELTDRQRHHRDRAIRALTQLSRHAMSVLAALRDERDQRSPGNRPEPGSGQTAILIARPQDPTLTWWTRAGTTLAATMAQIGELTRDPDLDRVLVVETHGYGGYRRGSQPVPLAVLCAIEQLAVEHDLPPAAIGEWLHRETGSAPDSPLTTGKAVIARFDAAYHGRFRSQREFAETERDLRGWTEALAAAQIPLNLFDLDLFTGQVFADQAHAIALPRGDIAVFQRSA